MASWSSLLVEGDGGTDAPDHLLQLLSPLFSFGRVHPVNALLTEASGAATSGTLPPDMGSLSLPLLSQRGSAFHPAGLLTLRCLGWKLKGKHRDAVCACSPRFPTPWGPQVCRESVTSVGSGCDFQAHLSPLVWASAGSLFNLCVPLLLWGESRNAFLLEILWEWDDVGWERGVCSHDKGWGLVIRIVIITSFPLLVNLCLKKKNRYSILPSCSTFVSCLNNIPNGAFPPSLGPEGKRIQVALQNRYHHQPWHSCCLGRVIHTSYICMEMKLLDKIVIFFFFFFFGISYC